MTIARGSGRPWDASHDQILDHLVTWIESEAFTCLGARASIKRQEMYTAVVGPLADDRTTGALHRTLSSFVADYLDAGGRFTTMVVVFRGPTVDSEERFDELFWRQLKALHDIDARSHPWAADVSSEPMSEYFSYSVAGHPFFLVGMHPAASRTARRFTLPAIAFNSHRQFDKLKSEGTYWGLQARIRDREKRLDGNLNPNLSDFGGSSEARQYSGRHVESDWLCPFNPSVLGTRRPL